MRLSELSYDLPPELIAQEPASERDGSRLMILDRRGGAIRHAVFRELPALLSEGDLLVLNDTRVRPARLLARKPGGGRAEALLLERLDPPRAEEPGQRWRALVRGFPGKAGGAVEFEGGIRAVMEAREEEGGTVILTLLSAGDLDALIEASALTPLPPYIRREEDDPRGAMDRERYQTVYAGEPGAVAAPTAGLHFTARLLEEIRSRGIETARLTLHVGWGTFQPVRSLDLDDHRMQAERVFIPESLPAALAAARRRGGRIVAVGTTVVRALEGSADPQGLPRAGAALCDLFIRPGHLFRAVDGLVTNFHLPCSTLLALVCAFAGRERILEAYRCAVAERYRFYSYGDAMVIL